MLNVLDSTAPRWPPGGSNVLALLLRAVTEVAQVSSEIVTGRSGVEQQVRLDLVLLSL